MTRVVPIAFETVRMAIEPAMDVDVVSTAGDLVLVEPIIEAYANEYYVIVDGQAIAEPAICAVVLSEYCPVYPSASSGMLLAQDISDELGCYVRFLPISAQQQVDGSGRHVLVPEGETLGSMPWFWHVKTHVGRDDGTDTFTYDAQSPHVLYPYSYRARGKESIRHTLTFNGESSLATLARASGPSTFAQLTMGFAGVFHPGDADYYPIFEWLGTEDSYTQLRYEHGRISLVRNHVEIAAHESTNSSAEATIILVAFDGTTDIGRLLVLDRGRTSTEFGMAEFDYSGLTGTVGAARTRVFWPHEGYARFGDMEIFEQSIWDSALTLSQMERKAALMAAVYGVPL